LAQQFVAAPAKTRKDLFAQAKAAADAVDTSALPDTSSYVEYYIKTMQRVLDKGDSYLEQVGGWACGWVFVQLCVCSWDTGCACLSAGRHGRMCSHPATVFAAQQESKRLKKMAEDKAVAATKRETFEWRLNVLSSFTRKAGEQQQTEKQTEL
jgi:hypothetical protein